jgi:5'-nucleotidase
VQPPPVRPASQLSPALGTTHSVAEPKPSDRERAQRQLSWRSAEAAPPALGHFKLIGFNDFHGQLTEGRHADGRDVGGAVAFAAYLFAATRAYAANHLIVHAGDLVGASPPVSALLQDEPTVEFINQFANAHCGYESRESPQCNIVGTFGNHEFDEGYVEALRVIRGGSSLLGPFLSDPYRGAVFGYVSSNVVEADTDAPLVAPYLIKVLDGIQVGVVGATLTHTPQIVTPSGVAGLRFLDEAESINRAVASLKQKQVHTIILTIHQGGEQSEIAGSPVLRGEIGAILPNLDEDVDIVISGHTHQFTNALVPRKQGRPVLVTQAFSAGTAMTEIEVAVDRATGDVFETRSWVTTTFADRAPADPRLENVRALVNAAREKTNPLTKRVIGASPLPITGAQNEAGESALGDLIVDAQRALAGTELAFTNPGGIRADLDAGPVTWGEAFSIQPFNNDLVRLTMTGEQLLRLLEQQWRANGERCMLSVSGLTVVWREQPGSRVVSVSDARGPLQLQRRYSVVVNRFLAEGGNEFSVFTEGTERRVVGNDLDAFVQYIERAGASLTAPPVERIRQVR